MKEYAILDEVYLLADLSGDTAESLTALRDRNLDKYNSRRGRFKGYHCEICKDKGYIYLPDGEYGIKVSECSCMKIRAGLIGIRESGLSGLAAGRSFDNFTDDIPIRREMKEKALAFLREGDGSFFFVGGQSGSGKTHICTAVCVEFLKRGRAVKYIRWNDASREILALSENKNRELREKKLHSIETADILFIDDFLKSANPSEAEKSLAFNIIESRYICGGTTLISSGRCLSEINRIRDDIAGRIYEKTGGEFLLRIPNESRYNYRYRNTNIALQ